MKNQRLIAAVIAAAVAVSCLATVFAAESLDAADPPKTGHGSADGVSLTYIDSGTAGYGLVTMILDEPPFGDFLTVNLDGRESAPMTIPKDGRIVFASDGQLDLGLHSAMVSWTGFRTVINFAVVHQGEGVTGITLDRTSDVILVGTELVIRATLIPEGIFGYVTWTSSDTGIASVSEGRVTAKAAGSVTINAVCGNVSATFDLTVKTGTSEPVDTEVINDDGSVTRTTGTEISFDDGTSKREVVETTESSEYSKRVDFVSQTDTAGRTVSKETGTVTMKDSGVELSVDRSSVSVNGAVNESTLRLEVSDADVSTVAVESVFGGKTIRTSTTKVDVAATSEAGRSSLIIDSAVLNKASAQINAVSTQMSDVVPVLDLSAKTQSSTVDATVRLPAASLKEAADGTGAEIRVTTDVAVLDFSNAAVKEICETAGSEVDINTKVADVSDLTEEQRSKIGNGNVYSLSVKVGGTSVSDFGDGNTVTVSLPYVLGDGGSASDVRVWCVDGTGMEEFQCTYADGLATFTTHHLSLWAVGVAEEQNGQSGGSTFLYVVLVILEVILLLAGLYVICFRKR